MGTNLPQVKKTGPKCRPIKSTASSSVDNISLSAKRVEIVVLLDLGKFYGNDESRLTRNDQFVPNLLFCGTDGDGAEDAFES